MNLISNALYWISTGMLVPVIVLLILFFVVSIVKAVSFFGQYLNEKRHVSPLCNRIKQLSGSSLAEFAASLSSEPRSSVEAYAVRIIAAHGDSALTELILTEFELASEKEISGSRILARIGPMLGLMGTLIPMGPALVGLATGDIASMASNMQVAFATTVVGLIVSAIGYLTQQADERRVLSNLSALEYLSDVVSQAATPSR